MFDLLANLPFITLISVIIILTLWCLCRRPPGFPPGPPRMPLLGNLLSLDSDLKITCRKLRQRYGDIFSLYIFQKPLIIINGNDVIREALVKNADVFSDRRRTFQSGYLSKGKGVVNSSGDTWREQRKFALNTLRELGMGKSVLEDKIREEMIEFLNIIEEEKGKPFDCGPIIHSAVSNIICSVVFGKRFLYTDPKFRKLLDTMQDTIACMRPGELLDVMPLLRFLPGDPLKFRRLLRNDSIIQEQLIKPSIQEHLQQHDDEITDDFISAYIKEMKCRHQQDQNTSMDFENLQRVINDLFFAGTDTTATTIRWALVYCLNYPDVQQTCFQEIRDNIGLNRPPLMRDRPNLPYLEATIMEVLRLSNIAPAAIPRAMPHDIQFKGYIFPKGTTVIPMLDSVLQDPDIWGDPTVFRPDRFLDNMGKVHKMEEFVPFSLGRRACLGEAMARMELFLFIASMIQRFKFQTVDGHKPSMDGVIGILNTPKPFKIRAICRD